MSDFTEHGREYILAYSVDDVDWALEQLAKRLVITEEGTKKHAK